MKSLRQYIFEKIKNLPRWITGLIVFDIDDTLIKVDPNLMSIYKKEPGKPEKKLTTDEFAKDPDAADSKKKSWFDYRDFRDPEKVYLSIISGTPLLRNLKILDDYVNAGYDFCFLTARSCEDVIKKAIDTFIKIRSNDGALRDLGDSFKKTLSHAVNDESKEYEGNSDADKKANILIDLCQKYDRVVFVDDDHKNVSAARNLNIKNLKVIKAWED